MSTEIRGMETTSWRKLRSIQEDSRPLPLMIETRDPIATDETTANRVM